MKELLNKAFDFWIKATWLKEIDKQIDRLYRAQLSARKAKEKQSRQRYVLDKMIEEYNKIYPNDTLFVGDGRRN